MKKIIFLIVCIGAALLLTGCGAGSAVSELLNTELVAEAPEYDMGEATVVETDTSAEDNSVTITQAGSYEFTGDIHGRITVDAADDAKVKLILKGANITNENSACIYVINAGKVIVSCEEGTENSLTCTGTFIQTDDSNIDGAIFSRDDLQLSGYGKLSIYCECGHGVVAKDDLDVKNITLDISCAKKGITVNDECIIESGDITISSGSEGIEALIVDIQDGTINIQAGDDGVNASDGSGRSMDPSVTQDGAVIYIRGGNITIAAEGDGIDSNGDLYISGGTLMVTEFGTHADSAIDYSGTCEITGGTQNVPEDAGLDNMNGRNFGGFNRPGGQPGQGGGQGLQGGGPGGANPVGQGGTPPEQPQGNA